MAYYEQYKGEITVDVWLNALWFLGRLLLFFGLVAGLAYLAGTLVRWYQDR